MTNSKTIRIIVAIFCVSFATQVSAIDWSDKNANTGNLKKMVERVQDRFKEVNGNKNMRSTLEEAADQVKITLKDNRPSGDFISGCSGECLTFRENMLGFLRDLESSLNSMRSMGEPIQQDAIDFSLTKKAIRKAPGPVLFPLAVVMNAGGVFNGVATRFSNVSEALVQVRDDFQDRPSKCNKLLADPTQSRRNITILSTSGVALLLAGKVLLARGETNMMAKKKVGIHGYAGVIVEDNKKKKLGNLLSGIGEGLSNYAAKNDRTFYQCEILAVLFNHDEGVQAQVAEHDAEVQALLMEIIRLQLTPQGNRTSEVGGDFPL